MNPCTLTLLSGLAAAVLPCLPWAAGAQQVAGTPGSPRATTSISGKQLPAP